MIFFQDGPDEQSKRFQQLSFSEIKSRSRRGKNRKTPHHVFVSLQRKMHGRRLRAVIGKLSRRLAMAESQSRHFVLLFIKQKRAGRMAFRGQRMVWKAEQKRSTHAEKLLRDADPCSHSRLEIASQP